MTVFEPFELLARAITCVMQQAHEDWELLLVIDGPISPARFIPQKLIQQIKPHCPGRRIELWELPRAEGHFGNVARNFGMQQATGDYLCWVNHDNLITPDYLTAHAENITKQPGCLSVVDIDLWKDDRYFGCFPRKLAMNNIDLLCFALPRLAALEVDAFGGSASRVYAADWLVFDACQKRLSVEERRGVVGTHF